MLFARGEPLISKLAVLAQHVVLPATMVAALIYSPPNYGSSSSSKDTKSSN